jgi:predicted RNA methylase
VGWSWDGINVHALNERIIRDLPEKVDVVLTETLDSVGFEENTAIFMLDAMERFLKPGGCMIPQSLRCHARARNIGGHGSERP